MITFFLIEDKPDTFHSERFQKILKAGCFFKRLKYYLFDIIQIALQIGFMIVLTYAIKYFSDSRIPKNFFYHVVLIGLGVMTILIILNEISVKNRTHERSKEKQNLIYLILFSLIAISFVVVRSHMEAKAVKEDAVFSGVVVELVDDSAICSNDSLYYIGKTENYLFIHNEIAKKTEVIPISRVKTITFPN